MRFSSHNSTIIYRRAISLILSGIIILIILNFASNPLIKYFSYAMMLLWIVIFFVVTKKTFTYIKGDNGELDVGRILYHRLPKDFMTLTDFEDGSKRGNVDAIVVGPTGVWSFEIKSHKGHITFDGENLLNNGYPFETNFLSQAYAESKSIEKILLDNLGIQISVQPVLVFSRNKAFMKFGLRELKGVYVIGKKWIPDLLQNRNTDRYLTPEKCQQIHQELKKFKSVI